MPPKRKPAKNTSNFSADRPIATSKADRLGRRGFAEGLARQIQAWNGRDSLVIALCGEWGCGKTSLKNMVIEKLRGGASRKVDLLEFNPWEISGHDSLAASFFRELTLTLAPSENAVPSTKGTIQRLRLYAKLASFGGTALKAIGTALSVSGDPNAQAFGAVGEVASQSADVANRGAEAQEALQEPQQSLVQLKRTLARDMASLKRPVLIVIDDIDRLTTDEIREAFQLVKANADFPNLIYLLMFDREIVSIALDSISGGRGHEFLEKIVQVLFHVPQPSIKDVHKVLFDGLNMHLADSGVGERWENTRWSRMWPSGLSMYFANLRCVYRFLGSFGFHVSQMRNERAFELNPLDLVALETLRIFESSLYEALPASRSLLVGERYWSGYLNEDQKRKRSEEEVEKLLAIVPAERREGVREILGELFPTPFRRNQADGDLWVRQLRVGHKSFFDRYFTMALSTDDVSQADLDALRSNLSNPAEFVRACISLRDRDQLETAFERLDCYKDTLPKSVFPKFITSLIDASDLFPEKDHRIFFSIDTLTHACRLINFGLRPIEDEDERFGYLKDGLVQSTGLRLAVKIVAIEERRPDRSSREFLVSEVQWIELKLIAVERLRIAAQNGQLRRAIGLNYLLWRWKEWADEVEAKEWVKSQTLSSDDALWVLRTFLSTSKRESSKVTFVRYLSLETLEYFSDIQVLAELTESLALEKQEQDNKRALRAFRQALVWRDEGKPDSYHGDDWRGDNPLEEDS